jgi:hypothetical protein
MQRASHSAPLLIADWRDKLRTKLARTGLSFDLVRLDSDEEERLKAADFVRCCRALTWRPAT